MSAPLVRVLTPRWPGVTLTVVVLVAMVVATGCGQTPVGTVDGRRVLNESVLALSYQKQLDDREKAMAADLRMLVNALSKEDLDARRTVYQRELATSKQTFEDQLNAQIRKAVADVARKRRLRAVLLQQATPFGGIDVTADVIERLK